MILHSYIFRKVTIVGVGLMGGSLAKALKKYGLAKEISGYASRQSTIDAALKAGVIDEGSTDLGQAVKNADLIVLAMPVETIIKTLDQLNNMIKRSCLITDLGSTKMDIVECANNVLANPNNFIGSHPLVGSEKGGIAHSTAELFEDSSCIITPTKKTSQAVRSKVRQMWTKVGAKVRTLSAEDHDEILAYVSHLPHVLAFSLMGIVPKKGYEHAPKSFREITRIAGSSSQLWTEVCMTNSKFIVKALDEQIKILSYMRKAIVQKDNKSLQYHFQKAKDQKSVMDHPKDKKEGAT